MSRADTADERAPLPMRKRMAWAIGVALLGLAAASAYRELTSEAGSSGTTLSPVAGTTASVSAGAPAGRRLLPDLRFVDEGGASRSLGEFRGRVILLNVWATWCAPCRDEMPALERLQASLGSPGFEVVALSLDRAGATAVKRFYEELGLRALRIYVDAEGEALGKLGAVGIPLTVLVDREGRELWRVLGPRHWDQADEIGRIRAHLAELPAR
jgi:thiol-disulfide isomerase/thioredoxin